MSSSREESGAAALGPHLGREQWILKLGAEAAPGKDTSLEMLERRERVKYRLNHEDKPWKALPETQLRVLRVLSDTFGREDRFDEPSHCSLQIAGIETLTKTVEDYDMLSKPLFFDFCHHFIKNEYPRMRNYEDYCVLHGVNRKGVQDPRMSVLLCLAQFWRLYEKTITHLSKRVSRRDPFSTLMFEDVQLPLDPMRGTGGADDNGDVAISGGDDYLSMRRNANDDGLAAHRVETGEQKGSLSVSLAQSSESALTNGVCVISTSSSAVKEMGGIDGLEKIGIGISVLVNSSEEESRSRNVFFLRRWIRNLVKGLTILVPCTDCIFGILGLKQRDPNVVTSLISVEKVIRKEHKRRRKSRKKGFKLHIVQEDEIRDNGDIDIEQNYAVEALSCRKRAGKKWNSLAKKLVKLLQRWLLLIAVGPVVIMIMLRAFVEDPILTPYPPAEHVARKHLMLQLFGVFDLSIFSLIILFYFLGAQQNKLRGFHKSDRLMRLRPITVLGISSMLGITAMRFSLDGGQSDSTLNLLHFTTWALLLHFAMLVLLQSQFSAFVKRLKYEQTATAPWISIIRLLSTAKWIETGLKHCIKTTYRGDIQGKGLNVMQHHAIRHQRKITKLTTATSQLGPGISRKTRRRIWYMKMKRKRYNKAMKQMKVEIASHMIDVIYAGMKNARKVAIPTEICILAVHYVSYYNVHEYVKNNLELRSTFSKLRDMDKVWHYLMHAFELARAEGDLKSENWIRDQLEMFLVTDKLRWDSHMLVFKTKKRLHMLKLRTKAQLARLKKIGKISLFHKHHEHHHVEAVVEETTRGGAATNPLSSSSEAAIEKGTGQMKFRVAAGESEIKAGEKRQQPQEEDINSEEDDEGLLVVDIKPSEETASHYVKRLKSMRFLEIIANGVLGRKALIEEIVSIQGTQSELNCRLSASNMQSFKWRHEDWACAATAANSMNILHRGWTQTPVRDPKTGRDKIRRNGKIEYLYFNRRLNAATEKHIANGLTRKALPPWLLRAGGICPHGNLWTAKNIFESFYEILHRLEANKRHSKTSQPFQVKEDHVSKIITKERSWVESERQLNEALTQYQRVESLRMKKNFQAMSERLKMDPRLQGGGDDESSEDESDSDGEGTENL